MLLRSMLVCLPLTFSSSVSAKTLITLSYNFVEVEVSPRQETHQEHYDIHYELNGRSVAFSSSSLKAVSNLGERKHNANNYGTISSNVTKVSGNNTIISTTTYKSYVVKTTITTNGSDACTAHREAFLRPGHKYFEDRRKSNNEQMYLSSFNYTDMSCSINRD